MGCVVGRCWEARSSWVPVSSLVSPQGSLDRLNSLLHYFPKESTKRQDITGLGTVVRGNVRKRRVEQVEQVLVVICGASCLSHHRHLHYRPSMMEST